MPNYKYVPVAYHSRASSVRPSGGRRAAAEWPAQAAERGCPDIRAMPQSRLRAGTWRVDRAGQPAWATPIPIGEAAQHIAGFCLLNDWSARDIQTWESQPLGPFLAKSFRTSVSPWIITTEALAPFRMAQPRAAGWRSRAAAASSRRGRSGERRVRHRLRGVRCRRRRCARPASSRIGCAVQQRRELYWTVAQMVAHHASNGCNLRPGDLFGSGTMSGTEPNSSAACWR